VQKVESLSGEASVAIEEPSPNRSKKAMKAAPK